MAKSQGHHLHVWYPHVGMPQDQAHQEGTRPSKLGGIVLAVGVVLALAAWGTALIAILILGPGGPGTESAAKVFWTAVAIASAMVIFSMGIWKITRA